MSVRKSSYKSGITLIEILVAITIVAIIGAIGMTAFYSQKKKNGLDKTTDSIVTHIESARADSIAGKGGLNHGVAFSTTTYTLFAGNSYNSSDTTNSVKTIDDTYSITSSFSNGVLIFSRITGEPQATGTITVSYSSDSSQYQRINIGNLGDVSVIK